MCFLVSCYSSCNSPLPLIFSSLVCLLVFVWEWSGMSKDLPWRFSYANATLMVLMSMSTLVNSLPLLCIHLVVDMVLHMMIIPMFAIRNNRYSEDYFTTSTMSAAINHNWTKHFFREKHTHGTLREWVKLKAKHAGIIPYK